MEIFNINDAPTDLMEALLSSKDGQKNEFSILASKQTGNDRTVPQKRIDYIMDSADHIMLICVEDGKLLGMTLGQRVTGIANTYMYIHDVVVDEEIRGRGIGSKLVSKLLKDGEEKWPDVVRFQLTSRPSRGAGPFFQKFGFRPRTKEAGDETIVYVKDLGDYRS